MNAHLHSRRQLLLTGAAGVTATLLSNRSANSQENKSATEEKALTDTSAPLPAKMRLSLSGYTFRDYLDKPGEPGKMSLFDLADIAARLGLDGVEPTSYFFLKTDDEYIYKLKHHIFKAGLEVSGMPLGNNFALPPGKEIDQQHEDVRKWVDVAVKLGSPHVRIFAGRVLKKTPRAKAFQYTVDNIKKACDYAGSKGIFLNLEDHNFLTETADDLLKLYKAVNHPWLGINLDTGNFRGEPYSNIAKAAPYASVCQVKHDVRGPKRRQKIPADFNRIIKILREARFRGYVTLEYEGPDPHTQVPVYIRKLKEALGA